MHYEIPAMNKITIDITNQLATRHTLQSDIKSWLIATIGPEIPKRPNNTKRRRSWSIQYTEATRSITIMVRDHKLVPFITLVWV